MTTGEKIRFFRQRKNMTQSDLARAAGVKQSLISRIEGAKVDAGPVTLEQIGKALGVRISQLVGASEYEKPKGLNSYQRMLIKYAVNFRIEEEIGALAEGMGVSADEVRAVYNS